MVGEVLYYGFYGNGEMELLFLISFYGLLNGGPLGNDWEIHSRDQGTKQYGHIAFSEGGRMWMGCSDSDLETGLFEWQEDHWEPVLFPGLQFSRYFVLDGDGVGIWVCPYSGDRANTYEGLTVLHFDGRVWQQEVVTPGIWPQAMDMLSPQSGCIGGNNGKFLHRAGGNWVLRTLDIKEEDRRDLNIYDIKMLNNRNGWAVGNLGLVARYKGGFWHVLNVPREWKGEKLHAVDIDPTGRPWVAGTNGLLAYREGRDWHRVEPTPKVSLNDLAFFPDGRALLAGEKGTVLVFSKSELSAIAMPTTAVFHQIASEPSAGTFISGEGVVLQQKKSTQAIFKERFWPENEWFANAYPYQVLVADLNGDHLPDLLCRSRVSIHLLLNQAGRYHTFDSPFTDLQSLENVGELKTMALGDMDGDADLDLLLAGEKRLFYFENNGNGQFSRKEVQGLDVALEGEGFQILVADLDGDERLDLYLCRSQKNSTLPLKNLVFWNKGRNGFTLGNPLEEAPVVEHHLLAGDLNGDLAIDAVATTYNGNETPLYLNDGRGKLNWVKEPTGLACQRPRGNSIQAHLADLDLDGDLDLVYLSDSIYAFFNDGTGRFQPKPDFFEPLELNPDQTNQLTAAGDLDLDGHLDFIFEVQSQGKGRFMLYLYQPGGGYRLANDRLPSLSPSGHVLSIFDLDNDGDLDMLTTQTGGKGLSSFENVIDNHRFLKIRLMGAENNTHAVGARVYLFDAGHVDDMSRLRGHQQAGLNQSLIGGQELGTLHFGLANGGRYDIRVDFPSGTTIRKLAVASGQRLTIIENEARQWGGLPIWIPGSSPFKLSVYLFAKWLTVIGVLWLWLACPYQKTLGKYPAFTREPWEKIFIFICFAFYLLGVSGMVFGLLVLFIWARLPNQRVLRQYDSLKIDAKRVEDIPRESPNRTCKDEMAKKLQLHTDLNAPKEPITVEFAEGVQQDEWKDRSLGKNSNHQPRPVVSPIDPNPLPLSSFTKNSKRFYDLVYASRTMSEIRGQVQEFAASDIPVLIQGETGTGKELVANAIHRESLRARQPWIPVNMAAIHENLLESELFGHCRGAFSGATQDKKGLFEQARGGSVFLDEIADATPRLQMALLRFLETGQFRRIGETMSRKADVRIISAANRDLRQEVRQKRFREDLFFRLRGIVFTLPPLRQRQEDIAVLTAHFIALFNQRLGKDITHIQKDLWNELHRYGWPGNIRELKSEIFKLAVYCKDRTLATIPETARHRDGEKHHFGNRFPGSQPLKPLAQIERDYLAYALAFSGGNQTKAAESLGLNRSTFRSKLRKHRLLEER